MKAPILKGKKVILKPINVKEAENYIHWLTDVNVNKFLKIDGRGINLKKEKEFIVKSNKDRNKIDWSIYTKEGRHIGSTGLKNIDTIKHMKAIWGICIGRKNYWGKGYGTDVLRTILRYCFNKLKLNRVELSVYPYNKRGIRCYEKCSFKQEGLKRKSIYKNNKFINEIIMGILKSEYKKLKNI